MPPTVEARRRPEVTLELHERQGVVFESPATEILFGGAAGGGKSHLLRVAFVAWCVAIPGLQCYLFRRTYQELVSSHLEGAGSFFEILAPWLETGHAKINLSDMDVLFPAVRSAIHLRHCQYEADLSKYQSAEIHVLGIDEATHFTDRMIRFLRARMRLGGLKIPPEFAGLFPRAIYATNPGGIGHNSVKAAFVDPKPPLEVWRAPASEGGLLRQFVPSKLSDNPTLTENDPNYAQRLEGLGTPDLVRAWLEGDWNIVAGGALDDVWQPARQVLKPFQIPAGWRVDRSFDWGSSRPFSVGWWAESNGEAVDLGGGERMHLPAGSLVQIAELYGWNGKPNEGCRKVATEIAREVLAAEAAIGIAGRVEPGPADSAIFAVENGQSIADDMARAGVRWTESEKGPGSRKTGLERLRRLLKAAAATPREEPGLFFFDTCRHSLRTLPVIPRDPRKPDDVDTEAEDHCLAGETLVVTAGGEVPIAQLVGRGGLLVSHDGRFHEFEDVRLTRKQVVVVDLVVSDGRRVRATPDHRMLCADGRWRSISDLRKGDRLLDLGQLVRYSSLHEGEGHKPGDSRVQRHSLLPLRAVLPAPREATAPGRLGVSRGGDPGPNARSSSGRQPLEQPGGKPDARQGRDARLAPLEPADSKSKRGAADEPARDSRVAPLRGRSSLARRHGNRGMELPEAGRAQLPDLRKAVPDLPFGRQVLSPELPPGGCQGAQAGQVAVVLIEPAGLADVYNLHVHGTHSLVVAGGLVAHNCYDMARYRAMDVPAAAGWMDRPW